MTNFFVQRKNGRGGWDYSIYFGDPPKLSKEMKQSVKVRPIPPHLERLTLTELIIHYKDVDRDTEGKGG